MSIDPSDAQFVIFFKFLLQKIQPARLIPNYWMKNAQIVACTLMNVYVL
jgi:hypothetical protein